MAITACPAASGGTSVTGRNVESRFTGPALPCSSWMFPCLEDVALISEISTLVLGRRKSEHFGERAEECDSVSYREGTTGEETLRSNV